MRHLALFTACTLLALACGDAKAPPPQEKAEAKADPSAAAKPKAEAGDEKATPEPSEAEKKAEAEKRGRERLAKLAEATAKEKARWTDELRAAVKGIVGPYANLDAALDKILASPHRTPGNAERDKFRHPKETLAFFGVTPTSKVLEVGPGAGWYTEILAPLLAAKGKLIVTDYNPDGPELEYSTYNARRLAAFLGRSEALFGKVERVVSEDPKDLNFGPDGSVDTVLIIRGLHGWQNSGKLAENLAKIHAVLEPGGTLGIVQHRAKKGADPKESAKNGYLPQDFVIEQVEAAGFELVEASELNANPKDTTDHPKGVWNLPPTLTDGDENRAAYEAIGESDRMTLKFVKK